MAGKGGGAWKVAYADFVTAMMAFFLVMWITGQDKPVKEAVSKYFEDPFGDDVGSRSTSLKGPYDSLTVGNFDRGRGPAAGMVMSNLKSTAPLNTRGTSAVMPPRMTIFQNSTRKRSLGTALLFAEGSADLDEQGRKRLDSLIPLLLGKANKVEVRGFTSRRPLDPDSPYRDSRELCYARCMTTMKYLIERNIHAERMRICLDGEPEHYAPSHERDLQAELCNVEVFASDMISRRREASDQRGPDPGHAGAALPDPEPEEK